MSTAADEPDRPNINDYFRAAREAPDQAPRAPLFTEIWWWFFRWPKTERVMARCDLHAAEQWRKDATRRARQINTGSQP